MMKSARTEELYETMLWITGWLVFGAIMVSAIITIWAYNRQADQQSHELAQQCITKGGSWVKGSCLFLRDGNKPE